MKKYHPFVSLIICSICILLSSCVSVDQSGFGKLEPDDQIASETPVISAKKVELGRYDDGTSKGYKYISEDGSVTFAEELIDEKGNRIIEGRIPDGLIVQYYDEGNIAAELNYNAGRLEGVVKEYFPDGIVSSVKNYKSGELNGPVKEYYPNGKIKEDFVYINGLLNGALRKYSDTGTILSRAEYQDGELNGTYKEFFVNSKVKIEIEYMNNKKEGYQREFDPSGILLAEYNYTMNKLEGQSKKYYEDGSIQMIANYVNNIQEGETKIFSNNNSDHPIYIDIYKNGKKIKRKAYSSQGKLIFTFDY
ncbi:MAG: toxin-antitoxin system YwqK family antitoxin [Endomicrobium sp.]|jgi:antitoxin component YwqK of YwqJK toxin-antitoxin module|nr:toxin-antitoxin system YwqK family antitoxin [Endomicrobium sp.]